jgi:hypothetical protein
VPTYAVTVEVYPEQAGHVNYPGLHNLPEGAILPLVALASDSFRFVAWKSGEETLGTESVLDFVMPTREVSLKAVFERTNYLLQYFAGDNGGLMSLDGQEGFAVQHLFHGEDSVGVRAVPDPGYMFDKWSDERRDNPRREINVARNFTATAIFKEVPNVVLAPPTLHAETPGRPAGSVVTLRVQNHNQALSWLSKVSEVWVADKKLDKSEWSTGLLSISLHGELIPELQQAGDHEISVYAAGFATAKVSQRVTATAASYMTIETQPAGPQASTGGLLARQPVIKIWDMYDNPCLEGPGAETAVTVLKASGLWELGGTLTISSREGIAAFADLTAISVTTGLESGKMHFESPGLQRVTSDSFHILKDEITMAPPRLTADTSGNYAGNTLKIAYVFVPGSIGIATVKVDDKVLRHPLQGNAINPAQWSYDASHIMIHTDRIPHMQARGQYTVSVEMPGYPPAKVVQTLTAGIAHRLAVVTQPAGPDYEEDGSVEDWRALAVYPTVEVYDRYGNLCFDGPSPGMKIAVAKGDNDSAWEMRLNTSQDYIVLDSSGRVVFDNIEVRNRAQTTVSTATIRISGSPATAVWTSAFDVPCQLKPAPLLQCYSENLAGEKIVLTVISGKTQAWLSELKLELNSFTDRPDEWREVPTSGYLYVPEFSAFVVDPLATQSLMLRGEHTIKISSPGFQPAELKVLVKANRHAEIISTRMVVGSQYWGAPLIVQPRFELRDKYRNICADGPSATGVYVTLEEEVIEAGIPALWAYLGSVPNTYDWNTDMGNRRVLAVNGIAEYHGLHPVHHGGLTSNLPARYKVKVPGLVDYYTDYFYLASTKPVRVDESGWPRYPQTAQEAILSASAGPELTPEVNIVISGTNVILKFNRNAQEPSWEDWLIRDKLVTVDGYLAPQGSFWVEKGDVGSSAEWFKVIIDTSKVPELRQAGPHRIRIYATDHKWHLSRYFFPWSGRPYYYNPTSNVITIK